jgi:serine/threonine protein kinase/Tfp pilus assembly protein PilF
MHKLTQNQYVQVEHLFEQALKADSDRRQEFLETCSADSEVLAEVASLLKHYQEDLHGNDPINIKIAFTPNIAEEIQVQETGFQITPGEKIGKYTIVEKIGKGGMGVVYKVTSDDLERPVALKVIRQDRSLKTEDQEHRVARFQVEKEVQSKLQHPNIVSIFDSGTGKHGEDDVDYFVMEYFDGCDLKKFAKDQVLRTDDCLRLIVQICGPIEYARIQEVVHRDLKPDNILVVGNDRTMVLDFGVAKTMDSTITQQGQLLGTLRYMSPEQVSTDSKRVDHRSDVYSLGVIAYELLTGQLPYELSRTNSYAEAVKAICHENPRPADSIKPGLDRDISKILSKAMAKEKEDRYQSAGEFSDDIKRYLDGNPINARPPNFLYQSHKLYKKHKAITRVSFALFLAVVVGLFISLRLFWITKQKENELREVAEFQEAQLEDVDPQSMGVSMYNKLRTSLQSRLASRAFGESEIVKYVKTWDELSDGNDYTGLAKDLLNENVFAPSLNALERKFPEQPLIKARLLQSLASVMRELGLLHEAVAPQEEALSIRLRLLAEDNRDTLASTIEMGLLREELAEFTTSETHIMSAMKHCRLAFGDDDPLTLKAINVMGNLLRSMGKHEEAEPYCREALERRREVLGDEHADTLTSLNNMALLHRDLGDYSEAKVGYEEVLNTRLRTLGEHKHTAISMNNLACVLADLGDLERAEKLYRQAFEAQKRLHGVSHPATLSTLSNLSVQLKKQKKYAEAEALCMQALEGRRAVLGSKHPDTLTSVANMGQFHFRNGRPDKAEACEREALDGRRQALGDEHPDTLRSVYNLGFLVLESGEVTEALELLKPAEELTKQKFSGDQVGQFVKFLRLVGRCHIESGSFLKAEEKLLDAWNIVCKSELGEEFQGDLRASLVELFDEWNRAEPEVGHSAKIEEWREARCDNSPEHSK